MGKAQNHVLDKTHMTTSFADVLGNERGLEKYHDLHGFPDIDALRPNEKAHKKLNSLLKEVKRQQFMGSLETLFRYRKIVDSRPLLEKLHYATCLAVHEDLMDKALKTEENPIALYSPMGKFFTLAGVDRDRSVLDDSRLIKTVSDTMALSYSGRITSAQKLGQKVASAWKAELLHIVTESFFEDATALWRALDPPRAWEVPDDLPETELLVEKATYQRLLRPHQMHVEYTKLGQFSVRENYRTHNKLKDELWPHVFAKLAAIKN